MVTAAVRAMPAEPPWEMGNLDDWEEAEIWFADVHLLVDAALRVAAERGTSPRGAMTVSGLTLDSLGRRAVQARREAWVQKAVAQGTLADTMYAMTWPSGSLWSPPLLWDQSCHELLLLRHSMLQAAVKPKQPVVDVLPAQLSWPLCPNGGAADHDAGSRGGSHGGSLNGTWRAEKLVTLQAMHAEGKAQRNCLRTESLQFLAASWKWQSYWSLQFVPAPGELERLTTGGDSLLQAQRALRRLRLTVELDEWLIGMSRVRQAYAACNEPAHPAAQSGLHAWLQIRT